MARPIDRFEILGLIAERRGARRSGSSTVMLARSGGVPVVLKRISDLGAVGDRGAAFVAALEPARVLRHPNLVAITEAFQQEEALFMVLDHVLSETVTSVVKKLRSGNDTLSFTLAAHVVREACAGLAAAHEAGIVHGHLTPDDLFIGYDGQVRVLGVGVARALEGIGVEPTRRTLSYASPEHCEKAPLDARSDVFSLGAILWELATGQSPFDRVSEAETIRAICTDPFPVPPELPEDAAAVVLHALARDRDARTASARALGDELGDAIARLGGELAPADTLGALMRRLFGDRLRQKESMLSSSNEPEAPPTSRSVYLDPESARARPEPRPDRRRRIVLFLVVAVLLVAVGAAVRGFRSPPPANGEDDPDAEVPELPLLPARDGDR